VLSITPPSTAVGDEWVDAIRRGVRDAKAVKPF
jgi:hypothetical protein